MATLSCCIKRVVSGHGVVVVLVATVVVVVVVVMVVVVVVIAVVVALMEGVATTVALAIESFETIVVTGTLAMAEGRVVPRGSVSTIVSAVVIIVVLASIVVGVLAVTVLGSMVSMVMGNSFVDKLAELTTVSTDKVEVVKLGVVLA